MSRPISESTMLRGIGWKTAAEIIKEWNAESGADEHPTIAGQILARNGLNNYGTYRWAKSKPALYSPEAISYIRRGLEWRL